MFGCSASGVGFDLFGLGVVVWGGVWLFWLLASLGFVMVVFVGVITSLAGMVFRRVTLVFLCCACFVVCLVYFSLRCCIVVM